MDTFPLIAAVLAVAFLYSSVGHAGASGYIAAMTLFGVAALDIKPAALTLNILVAAIATVQFLRAGHFSWALFWPFALLSAPAAYLGGYLHMPASLFRPLLGAILWFSAVRFLLRQRDPDEVRAPGVPLSLGTGVGIGFVAGMTGTGGGIFLTPLLLLCRWAKTRNAAAVSAPFILVNSVSGILGHVGSGKTVPAFAWALALAAVAGGVAGSYCGSLRFPVRVVRILLAAVLLIAGGKLLLPV